MTLSRPPITTTTARSSSRNLHWAQLDVNLPEEKRRVEVSVQKTVEDKPGHFAGVLRVGLLAAKIDEAVKQHITEPGQPDDHLIFLCDQQGRLITGFPEHEHVTVTGFDLRVPTDGIPGPGRARAEESALAQVDEAHPNAATMFTFDHKVYLCSFHYLPMTQDWIVGIVVPRSFYLGDMIRATWQIFWAGPRDGELDRHRRDHRAAPRAAARNPSCSKRPRA